MKQFNVGNGVKATASVGSLQNHSKEHEVYDHGYGHAQPHHAKQTKKRQEFRVDPIRSESDPRGKRKAKKLPPI